ncbi:MAG: DUF177 domain-containing protein [Acidobacteriaceae bacterium]|nr:DUF177 domain-containing protein [Acidobacteriaceae bacterium]
MFISLGELEQRTVRFEVDIPPGDLDLESKIRQSSILHTQGTAQLLNASLGEIRVVGDLRVKVEGTCDRCTEAAGYRVENHFDLVYMPANYANSSSEEEVDEAAIEVGYYEGNGLELKDVLREVVLLALPMRLVCSEGCKGICAVCGQNRNQIECGCRPEIADDRWSRLKSLRAELGPHT